MNVFIMAGMFNFSKLLYPHEEKTFKDGHYYSVALDYTHNSSLCIFKVCDRTGDGR